MEMSKQTEKLNLRRLAPLLIIICFAVLGAYLYGDLLTFETLRDNRDMLIDWRDQNYASAALAYITAYILIVAFSLPGSAVMTLAGGFLFGVLFGAMFSVVGASIGAVAIFMAAKTGLGDHLHKKMQQQAGGGGFIAKMEQGLHENEISYLFLMRLVPAVPFFIANLAPAFLGVKTRNYVLTTVFGIIPGALVYSSVGFGLGDVFAAGETPNLGIIFEPQVLMPIIGLCLLAALPIFIKALSGNKDKS